MSDSNQSKTFNVKKNKKFLAKKRKLEAFLNLVREDELKSVPRKKKSGSSFQESYKALKDELRKYQKTKSGDPSFALKEDGRCALIDLSLNGEIPKSTLPLFLEDIHHLLLTAVLGNVSPYPLRWATLKSPQNISKTVLIEIEALSKEDVKVMHSELNENCGLLPFVFEIVSSNIPFGTDMSTMHLTISCNENKGNYSSMFPVTESTVEGIAKPSNEYKFSKLHLLLSPIQLAMEHYPLPQNVFEQSKSEGYFFSKDKYTPVNDNSPLFAVDCEMCRTVSSRPEVTRIAIVNENLETIYHTLVKPKDEIIDYATKFSGITERMLRDVTTTLDDVHREIRKILPSDAILCGQSLNCDLHALKMIHPYVIDTSIIFNSHGIRHKKTSLKQLARIHLKESIQDSKNGHNPIEDAIATMRLVQLKLRNCIEYGDEVLSEDNDQNSAATNEEKDTSVPDEKCKFSDLLKLNPDAIENGFFSRLLRFSKKTCLIGSELSLNNYIEEMITDNVTQVIKSKKQKILKAIPDNIENHDLIISHLSSEIEEYSVTEEIKQVYATLPSKTFFIILMSGISKESNEKFKYSYCMLAIKK